MSVYDEPTSPAAGLLRLARDKAGITQTELARRAGVPSTMVSAYERSRRQPTLPTLMSLLKAAGFELRMHLAPYDDHDDVLAEHRERWTAEERRHWDDYQSARLSHGGPILEAQARRRARAGR